MILFLSRIWIGFLISWTAWRKGKYMSRDNWLAQICVGGSVSSNTNSNRDTNTNQNVNTNICQEIIGRGKHWGTVQGRVCQLCIKEWKVSNYFVDVSIQLWDCKGVCVWIYQIMSHILKRRGSLMITNICPTIHIISISAFVDARLSKLTPSQCHHLTFCLSNTNHL